MRRWQPRFQRGEKQAPDELTRTTRFWIMIQNNSNPRLDHFGRDFNFCFGGSCLRPRCPVGHFLYLGSCGVNYVIGTMSLQKR